MNIYVIVLLILYLMSAISQVILKKGTDKNHEGFKNKYLNINMLAGNGLMVLCMFGSLFCIKHLEFKMVSVLSNISYVFVLILGKIFFNEKITTNKCLGVTIIIFGILIFNINI